MNYIILNGKKSTTIQGLLISSLPPISKPLMRTQIEEIDGRDGDIVTKLGYAAYNKEITIGLYGDYDVDDVISYFDSEGIVTFSNEPTKYYTYQILNQIDFERLIRFKTATVILHVQPFKYSAIEKALSFSNTNPVRFSDYTVTKNGITLTAQNGIIQIAGQATANTEIYMPIYALSLKEGDYTLNASAGGTGVSSVSIRLIHDSPSSLNSFGGTFATLQNYSIVTIHSELTAAKIYNYLYFYIAASQSMDFMLDVSMANNSLDSVTVSNTGNIASKPILTIYGSGTVAISINGMQIFIIELGESEEYITIDAAQMEAYKDGVLKNRLVSGDYDNFLLKIGKNEISWSGNVTRLDIANYSRWI